MYSNNFHKNVKYIHNVRLQLQQCFIFTTEFQDIYSDTYNYYTIQIVPSKNIYHITNFLKYVNTISYFTIHVQIILTKYTVTKC